MNKSKKNLMITLIVIVLPLIPFLFFYLQLPAQLAIHFTGNGHPDGYAPKAVVTFALPALFLLAQLYVYFQRYQYNEKRLYLWMVPVLGVLVQVIILIFALYHA